MKQREGYYQFPAKIQQKMRPEVWQMDPSKAVYVGRRIQCQSELEIITPAAFPHIQSILSQNEEYIALIWQGGMKINKQAFTTSPGVECLVVVEDLTKMIRAIDIVTRGPQHTERECKRLMDEIEQLVMQVLDGKSPGTTTVRRYLSRSHIANLNPRPVHVSEEAIKKARRGNGIVLFKTTDDVVTETVVDLLAVDDDHVIFLPKEAREQICNFLDQARDEPDYWYFVGERLGIRSDMLHSFRTAQPGSGQADLGSTSKMLDYYASTHLADATTSHLIEAVASLDRADVLAVFERHGLMRGRVCDVESAEDYEPQPYYDDSEPGDSSDYVYSDSD